MNIHQSPPSGDSHVGASARLLCRIVRQWAVVSRHEKSRHVASCVACQEYFRANAALDRALRTEAEESLRVTPAPSGNLEWQIMQAVRTAGRTPTPRRTRSSEWRGLWTMGGFTAAVAVVAALVTLNRHPHSATAREDLANVTPTAADAQVIVQAVESLSNRFVDSVIPSAGELVAENPLQQELGSVYSDVRSALDFLALNFLPTSASSPSANRDRTI
jgi:hypothetical protein